MSDQPQITDDERIAEIEGYHRRYFPVPNVSSHVEDLLRIVRSLQVALMQVQQENTILRTHIVALSAGIAEGKFR